MPIVSINLSAEAYEVYQAMVSGRRSARVSYLLVRHYKQTKKEKAEGQRVAPILEVGDRRIARTGEELIWTLDGWKVME
tara:strand:- start:1108 stop:1344 length:237 start_codon:yes stop_codon:yes gene_type:complete